MELGIIVLAAGQGTRMRSSLPKVLHPLAGKPLLSHVLETAARLSPKRCVVVYGHGGDTVRKNIVLPELAWVEQTQQMGTGHAVQQAMPALPDVDQVLVLYGDVPLISVGTLSRLIKVAAGNALSILTAMLDDASGYGRIMRDAAGNILRIVEQKDADPEALMVNEINTGIMLFDRFKLIEWLARMDNNNAQGEYYLTDVVAMAVAEGLSVASATPDCEEEVLGVNNRAQLSRLERHYQSGIADALMAAGITLADPARVDVRGSLRSGQDVSIDINFIAEGEVVIEDNVHIGPNCLLKNCTIGAGTIIQANSIIEDSIVGRDARIGPFARLRPDSVLADRVHVGNFVEIKKSTVAEGSKINHLTYIGDSDIGQDVNVGAGTITCNYDGAHKHRTRIGDHAFIGSNSALVAPVEIAEGATIGAGSVITKKAPAHALTLARAKQASIENWQRPKKDIR
jgi:bifunctional UDP-N-acetylglucosamine pyrophosphorylase/glucosamine-1-phosphate N-acetyltransferase